MIENVCTQMSKAMIFIPHSCLHNQYIVLHFLPHPSPQLFPPAGQPVKWGGLGHRTTLVPGPLFIFLPALVWLIGLWAPVDWCGCSLVDGQAVVHTVNVWN